MKTEAEMMALSNNEFEQKKRAKMGYEDLGLLHDMFVRQAKLTPAHVAVVGGDGRQLTFKELDNVTDVVATNLRIRGVLPDSIVGIYMEKCLEYVISYIAILKAGGAYMPIDVSYPIPLLEDIFADARPVAVLTEEGLTQYIPNDAKNVIKCTKGWIDRLREENASRSILPPSPSMTLENLAFTVYSSGTTGKPKGIQMSHRGVVFSYNWRHENHPYSGGDREASNVFFVWEMLRPILKGVTMYIIPDNIIYDPVLLCRFLADNAITRILFTPSLLEAVLETKAAQVVDAMKNMREIIFCGEVVTVGLLDRCIKAFPHVQILNLYSISEAHDIACADLSAWYQQEKDNLQSRKFCPVGKLLPGVAVVIMNDELQPQPVGVAGEIYIGGPTLARGYLNRPELNATRFISRPDCVSASFGDRMYKAGDWGYMLSDGSFEICGRCDTMVKIRGYSIEIQALEAALLELPMVNACVVVVMGAEGEDKYLVAYIVPEGRTCKKDVRAALKRRLPFYMIPSYFIFLNSIPILASSGKFDKKALPPVNRTEEEVDPEGVPTTDTERALVPIWAEVLNLKVVDVHESFFDLGGHSLLATKLLSRVREVFGHELSVKDLFVHLTISAMARILDMRSLGEVAGETNGISHPPSLDLSKEVDKHDQAVINMDMQLRSFWRSMQYGDRWNKARVLLTGGTGFLGSFVLRELLLNSKTHIFCVVRETPGDEGLGTRLRSTMVQYGMVAQDRQRNSTAQEALEAQYNERVTPIKGDVGLMNMGMSEEDYHYLCTEVDVVIHAAAYVNLIYPYEALHGPNVLGTENVLMFCCTSKIKPLHYISTDAVFPHGLKDCGEDADMKQFADGQLTDGYSQSKWVAEQLVVRAMDRGLPAAIYRPGNLSGDSKKAYWNPSDFTLLFLKGCFQVNAAPDLDWDMEMTPVDFTANFIVTLIKRMALGIGKVYHLTNASPIKSKWMFEWLNAHGHRLKLVPYKDWIALVQKKAGANSSLQRLVDNMAADESWFSQLSTYRNANVQKVLKILKTSYPAIDHPLLCTYFTCLVQRRVIPPVRRNTTCK